MRLNILAAVAMLALTGATIESAPLSAAMRPDSTAFDASSNNRVCPTEWAGWTQFSSTYIEPSGRVVDLSTNRRITVSEGQAYALFFALIAGDRAAFERILQWTEANLSGGSLKSKLPAWRWGRRDDNSWGILDDNSASDADLWIAYTLAQAARIWRVQRYAELSESLSDRILRESTAYLPGLGLVLLPAPKGFGPNTSEGVVRVRLNPSYLPINLLRWWASQHRDKRWREIHATSVTVIEQSANQGYAPDWVTVSSRESDAALRWSSADASEARLGSYDAVRVYLWLGLMPPEDAVRRQLLLKLPGMAHQLSRTGEVPERIDIRTGDVLASANPHLGWALLPYLKVLDREVEFLGLSERLKRLTPRSPAYYEDALMLFASGHISRIYRFGAEGSLELVRNPCSSVSLTPLSPLH